MARKVEILTISDEGRDNGKTFVLSEMSSYKAERWATRALLALANGGVELPDGVMDMGFAGIASVGLKALGQLRFEDAEPLLDEMWECVQFVPNASHPEFKRAVMHGEDGDIEEVKTRLKIRAAVFNLHVSFSQAATLPPTQQAGKAARKSRG